MQISKAYPSKFISADDVPRPITVTIDRVVMEKMQNPPDKPVVYFRGAQKGMVLNVTNGRRIAHFLGDDTDRWAGLQIELYPDITDYMGDTTSCIRVRQAGTMAPNVNAPIQEGPQHAPPVGQPAQPVPNVVLNQPVQAPAVGSRWHAPDGMDPNEDPPF